jgi:hypothetical protein
MSTVGAPGAHGAAVAGTQGMGVRTPSAAAVAVITTGFVGAEHMPKGGMFTIGLLSMMVAAGVPVSVLFSGSTTRVEGAAPKLHIMLAPMHTCIAMVVATSSTNFWVGATRTGITKLLEATSPGEASRGEVS